MSIQNLKPTENWIESQKHLQIGVLWKRRFFKQFVTRKRFVWKLFKFIGFEKGIQKNIQRLVKKSESNNKMKNNNKNNWINLFMRECIPSWVERPSTEADRVLEWRRSRNRASWFWWLRVPFRVGWLWDWGVRERRHRRSPKMSWMKERSEGMESWRGMQNLLKCWGMACKIWSYS